MKYLLFYLTNNNVIEPVPENKVDMTNGILTISWADGIETNHPMASIHHWLRGSEEDIQAEFEMIKKNAKKKRR